MNKTEMKNNLLKGVEYFFSQFEKVLSPSSIHFNDFLLQKNRYLTAKNDFNRGIINNNERDETYNKVQYAILNLIDSLEDNDYKFNKDNSGISKKETANAKINKNYVDAIVDFFDDIDSGNGLNMEITVSESGKTVLFYDKPLKVHLKRIEIFKEEKSLVFLSEKNSRRHAGLPMTDDVIKYSANTKEILLVRIDRKNQVVVSEIKLPLKVY